MVRLLNADIFGERDENKVFNEQIKNVKVNVINYIKHGIYFGDTLDVCLNPQDSSTRLSLDADYTFAELDTIATEQSNRDCYRAVVFLKDFDEVYISYHSYGDLVSAETFNEFIRNIECVAADIDSLNLKAVSILKDFQEHIANEKAHGASEAADGEKIAMRTKTGTLRASDPKEAGDLVTLNALTVLLQEAANNAANALDEKTKNLYDELYSLSQKLDAVKQTLFLKDFLPEGVSEDDATQEQKEAGENAMKERASQTKPFYNAIRNANGSIVVPEAKNDNEAVNLKTVNDIATPLTTSINTLTASTDSLQNAVTELKNKKDVFDFASDSSATDKTFDGKPVYRKGFQVEIPQDEKKNIKVDFLKIDTVVSIQGMVTKGKEIWPLALSGVTVYIDDYDLNIEPKSGDPDCKVKVFIEYTEK